MDEALVVSRSQKKARLTLTRMLVWGVAMPLLVAGQCISEISQRNKGLTSHGGNRQEDVDAETDSITDVKKEDGITDVVSQEAALPVVEGVSVAGNAATLPLLALGRPLNSGQLHAATDEADLLTREGSRQKDMNAATASVEDVEKEDGITDVSQEVPLEEGETRPSVEGKRLSKVETSSVERLSKRAKAHRKAAKHFWKAHAAYEAKIAHEGWNNPGRKCDRMALVEEQAKKVKSAWYSAVKAWDNILDNEPYTIWADTASDRVYADQTCPGFKRILECDRARKARGKAKFHLTGLGEQLATRDREKYLERLKKVENDTDVWRIMKEVPGSFELPFY